MAVKELKKASGLYTNVNSLGSYPEGALLDAKNVVIDKDDIIEQRRGLKIYGEELEAVNDRVQQLLNFNERLLRHSNDYLQYETSSVSGDFETYQELRWNYAASGGVTSSGLDCSFTTQAPHGLQNNDVVLISGATPDVYNGSFTVTVVDEYTFEYEMSATGASPASGEIVLETSTAKIEQVDAFNKIRSAESPNGNFFFTSNDGIKKLDAVDTFIRDAGGVKALDLDVEIAEVVTSEVFPQNSQLGYRILWGYRDLNNNLILGTPSARATIGLEVSTLIIPDFNDLLDKIDAAAAVNTGSLSETNYNTLAIATTATAGTLNAALRDLCSKLELDMGYTNPTAARYGRSGNVSSTNTGSVVTITTATNHQLTTGDEITLSGTNAVPSLNDQRFTITVTGLNTFTINAPSAVTVAGTATGTWASGLAQDYPEPETSTQDDYITQQEFFNEIIGLLLSEPVAKIDAGAQTAGDFLPATSAKTVKLTFTVPDQITPNYFYQVYRTAPSTGSDVDPGDDMGLVYEANPTDTEIQQGYIEVTDDTPDDFRGAALYTNPRQEGILQSNEPPPFAKDITIFQNCVFLANTKTRHRLTLNMLGTNNLSGTSINIADVTYTFAATEDATIGQIKVYTDGTPSQNLDNTARSLIRVINRYSANTAVYAYYLSEVDQIPGQMLIEARDLDTPKFYALSSSPTVGSVNFSPNIAPDSPTITAITAGPNPVITTSAAHNIKAGEIVVLVGTDNSIDGSYTVESVTSTTFTIERLGITGTGTTGRFKRVTSVFGGVSDNEIIKNRLYYSKQQQFEAVPLLNYFDVGSGDKEILRILALRDSLFVLKEDGVYRVTGDGPRTFALSLFDNTAFIVGADTAVVGNNQIYCFSNQGVITVSDTGVQIISRPIENRLLPLISNQNIKQYAFSIFYQTDRKYIMWLPEELSDTINTIAYVYNNVTNAWTTWDLSKTCGVVNSRDDRLYTGASDTNYIEQERKDFARSDFADREYTLSITEYDPVTLTLKLSTVDDLAVGDVITQVITRNTVYGTYNYTIEGVIISIDRQRSNVVVDSPQYEFQTGAIIAYNSYESLVRWAPDSLDAQGTMKQFREVVLRLFKSRITTPILGFSSDLQSSIEEVSLQGPGTGLWGFGPWGEAAWGGDYSQRGFRTFVPLLKQRCSILNVYFRHKTAREVWQIEGLSLVYEAYSSKVNR